MHPPDGGRWSVLALVFAARVIMAVQLQSVGALGPALLADPALGLGYGSLGLLIGVYLLPGIFVALPAGRLALQLGEPRMVVLGLGLILLGGLVMVLAPGMASALVGRAVSGAGGALLNVVLAAMVIRRFQGAALAPAMGIFLAGYPLGIAAALMVLPVVADAVSWRVAMAAPLLPALLALGGTVVMLGWTVPAPPGPAKPARAELTPAEARPVLAAGAAWGSYNAGFAALLGFGPALLVEQGVPASTAGAMASLVGWISVPLLPFGGAIMGWSGRPGAAGIACLLAAGAAVLALAAGILPPAAAMIAAGLLLTPPAAVLMSLPAIGVAVERQARAMGLFYTLLYACMTVLPPLAGWCRDLSDVQAAPVIAAGLFILLAALFMGAHGLLAGSGGEKRRDASAPRRARKGLRVRRPPG